MITGGVRLALTTREGTTVNVERGAWAIDSVRSGNAETIEHKMLADHLGEAHGRGAMDLLESLDVAAILLNSFGEVIQTTRRAISLMGSDFCIRFDRIAISQRQASDKLNEALALMNSSKEIRVAGPLSIPRQSKNPVILHVVGLNGSGKAPPGLPRCAIVLAKDPDAPRSLMAEGFLGLLEFTPAEASLASLLYSGKSLSDAAEYLHITSETARTRLKSIFSKTNTNKQATLIAFLFQIAGPF